MESVNGTPKVLMKVPVFLRRKKDRKFFEIIVYTLYLTYYQLVVFLEG